MRYLPGINYVKEFYSIASIDHLRNLMISKFEVLGALFKYLETINFSPEASFTPQNSQKNGFDAARCFTVENLNLFRLEKRVLFWKYLMRRSQGMGKKTAEAVAAFALD